MRRPALCCFLPLLLVHAGSRADDAVEPTQVFIENGELNYIGALEEEANARLFALYEGLKQKPTTLSIRSTGGSTTPGLSLGQWVRDHKLDVKVMEYCLSSCANYVFPAGIHKVVSNFAVVGLHGGLSSVSFSFGASTKMWLDSLAPEKRKEALEKLDTFLKGNARKEQAYFKALGVRGDYVTLGQEERYQRLYRDDPKTVGWTYTLEDFGRLGVHDISVINPPWRPGTALKGVSFIVLKLDD